MKWPMIPTNLLWKDARQVLPSVAVCLGLAVLGQVLFISRWLRNEDFFELDIPRSLAMVGPLIVALACAGMIFGNERQSRTSHWISTLPVQWYQSVVSHILIASVCIVITAIVTHCIAWIAPHVDHDPLMGFLYSSSDSSSLFKVILFAGMLFFFSILGTLLIEETLYGLCAAGIAFISINALVSYIVENTLSYNGWNSIQANYDAVLYPSFIVVTVSMLVVSVLVYRWRWTLGQFVDCWRSVQQTLRGPWRSGAEVLAESIPQRARGIPTAYPNRPFRTLLGQSLGQAPYFRIALVLAPWAIAALHERRDFYQAVFFFSVFSVMILGLSCFVADHAKFRFRFLADRGVPAWKFYWARTLPLFGIGVLMMFIATLSIAGGLPAPNNTPAAEIYKATILISLVTITFFFAGQLASLCFRNVLIAIGAVLTTTVGIVCMFGLFEPNPYYRTGSSSVLYVVMFVSFIASIATHLWIAIHWLIPTWSGTDRPERRLAGGFVVSGIVIPILLLHVIAIAGYWMIPRPIRISEKLSAAEFAALKPKSHDVDFALKDQSELFQTIGFFNSPLTNVFSRNGTSDDESFLMNEINAMTLDKARIASAIDWVTELNDDLDRSFARLQTTNASIFEIRLQDLKTLQHYSASCAAMSRLAILRHESELLEKYFDCFKKIQALYPWIDPISRIALHRRVLTVLSACTDEDLTWIAKFYSIKPLLTEVLSLSQYRLWVIERSLFTDSLLSSDSKWDSNRYTWDDLNRYRWRGSMTIGYAPTWYSALPHAIAKREYRYYIAREVVAELAMLDRLIERESQAASPQGGSNPEPITNWQSIPQPPYEFGFHLRDLLRYRELERVVADRVLANDDR